MPESAITVLIGCVWSCYQETLCDKRYITLERFLCKWNVPSGPPPNDAFGRPLVRCTDTVCGSSGAELGEKLMAERSNTHIWEAGHRLGLCCYHFQPVCAAAILQMHMIMLWLAADRKHTTPLSSEEHHSHIMSPQCCLWSSQPSLVCDFHNLDSLPRSVRLSTLCVVTRLCIMR